MRLHNISLNVIVLSALGKLCWGQTCIEEISEIYTEESQVTDHSMVRTYVLCPRRIYEIGKLDFDYEVKGFGVHPPLPIRPNIRYLCGDTGSREELCWLADGDVHIDATEYRGLGNEPLENVVIKGFQFIGARKHALWATKPGDITFIDCEFRDFKQSIAPIMLDWFDGTDSQLSVTFEDCLFHNNRYFGWGSHTSLIYANSAQNSLTVRATVFENNDMTWNNTLASTNSFIIETLGPLTVERSCFQNNIIGVSNVVVFGSQLIDNNIYLRNSTGNLCGFGSVFQNLQQFDQFTPLCVSSSTPSCLAYSTESPTASPTSLPTIAPSRNPTLVPSNPPTMVISGVPTGTPTPGPSHRPSAEGETQAPTNAPSVMTPIPTETPTEVRFVWPTTEGPFAESASPRGYCFATSLITLFASLWVLLV